MVFLEEETYAAATDIQLDAPWHLDILDQEPSILDGIYDPGPMGNGEGVDIYILDTGTKISKYGLKLDYYNHYQECFMTMKNLKEEPNILDMIL